MNEDFILNYQPFPGNVPGEGYIPVTTRASKDAPSTSDMWRYEKLTQVTESDKQQIQTNKENIEALEEELNDIYTKQETDGLLQDKEDKFTTDSTLEKDDTNKILKVKYLENHGLHRFATGLGINVDGTTIGFDAQGRLKAIGGGGGGEANVIESISVDNVEKTITNKNVNFESDTLIFTLADDSTVQVKLLKG